LRYAATLGVEDLVAAGGRRPLSTALSAAVVASLVSVVPVGATAAQAATPSEAQQWADVQALVGPVRGRWTNQAYSGAVSRSMPNTALLGNGDVGVVSGGSDGVKTFYVSKGNFWAGNPGPSLVALGGVTIGPAAGASSSNLALGATATASSSHGDFPPGRAVSGQWGGGYEGWVSAIGKPQTLTLDLGTAKSFTRYVVRHDAAARPAETANVTKNFTLQTSGNGSTWTTVDTVTNNTAATTDRTIAGQNVRYVRLNITEPTQGTTPDSVTNPRARIGQLELYAPGAAPAPPGPFLEEQNVLRGDVDTTMQMGGTPISMKTWTAANDNLVVTQIQSTGSATVRLRAETWSGSQDARSGFTNSAGVSGNTTWATRQTPSGANWVSRASLATRLVGGTLVGAPTVTGATGRLVFDLAPGQSVRIVTGVAGGGQNPADPAPAARALAEGQTGSGLDTLYNQHLDWWKQYWLKSYVDLDDDVLERYYYAAQYFLGSASRAGRTAPGLYGIWATTDFAQFSGDMHLNYNWMANFYGAYSSNRPELALPYFDLVSAYLPEARRRAAQDLNRVKPDYVSRRFPSGGMPAGLLFPVGIAPFGSTADNNYHQQVVDSLFTVSQYVTYYELTQDQTFLSSRAYPVMKEVAAFFENWLEWDPGAQQYVLFGGPHEGLWAKNPSGDVGMLKHLLSTLVGASTTLGVDADKRATWSNILAHLPAPPTVVFNGQTVYALATPGTVTGSDTRDIHPGDNTINLEFVHPGDGLGVGSPAAARQIAISTLDVMNSWGQDNSFPKVFVQAARVGYPAQSLIDRLKGQLTAKSVANLRVADGVHGLEKSGATEAVNSLLLQSDGGVLRVFPVWPAGRSGSFVRLRAKGAFVVSSSVAAGSVGYVDITSEKAGTVRLQNPWPGTSPVVTRVGGGTVAYTQSGGVIAFPAQAGATYTIPRP
jgi:alpha-L-fucosidase 2